MNDLKKNLPYILAGIVFLGVIIALLCIFLKPKQPIPVVSFPTPTPPQKVTPGSSPFIPETQEEEIPSEEILPTEIPSPKNFNEVLSQLNTTQKLIAFLNQNFELIDEESDRSLKPEEFFKAKKGNRVDIATFASFVLFQNGHFSTIVRYQYLDQNNKEKIRTLTLVREKDSPSPVFIDLEGSKLKIYPGGNSPIELLELEEKRHNVKIIKYAAFNYGTTDFTKGDWLPR